MSNSTKFRDLVYFDINKAASIFSQLEMGLLTETKSTQKDTVELINELLKQEETIPREKKEVVFSLEEERIKVEKNASQSSKAIRKPVKRKSSRVPS